jgi:predicted TIM-barrel enzyme
VLILADVQVKYATMIEPRPLAESAALARDNRADAIVVTGDRSGHPPSPSQLGEAGQGLPVLIGSGLDADNAAALLPHCAGAIVGTTLMREGSVDRGAAEQLMAAAGR